MKTNRKNVNWVVVSIVIVFVIIIIRFIVLILQNSVTYDSITNIQNLQEYNQSYIVGNIKISLTHAIYSDISKNGYCVFEVEDVRGKKPWVRYTNGNEVSCFGEKERPIAIRATASGSITSRLKEKDNVTIIETEFHARPDGDTFEEYERHQILAEECNSEEKKTYGFKLENNIGGKLYESLDGVNVSVSCLGISIESKKEIKSIYVKEKNGEERIVFDKKNKKNYKNQSNILGYYFEDSYDDKEERVYIYQFVFCDLQNIEEEIEIKIDNRDLQLL